MVEVHEIIKRISLFQIMTCTNLNSSYIFVKSLLEDIVEKVMREDEGEENNSLELTLSSTPDHPLPCSEDFQFFFSIAKTVPPHSPDSASASLSCSGVTPPSSLLCTATPGRSSCTPSPPPSPGVTLLPLSGQMTQATIQEPINYCEEPASKKIKLETDEHTDLLEDVNILDDDEDDSTDDEIAPLPLTFSTPADLMWKLQKAEIIPSRSGSRGTEQGQIIGEEVAVDIREKMGVESDIVKRHSFVEESRIIKNKEEVIDMGGALQTVEIIKKEKADVITDEVEVVVEKDDIVLEVLNKGKTELARNEYGALCHSQGMVNLLNKPPRLGLSKLYKSSTSLHDISIVEQDKNINCRKELFIIEKEE